jgi:hypothetical protein
MFLSGFNMTCFTFYVHSDLFTDSLILLKSSVFRDMMRRVPVEVQQCFGGIYCFH